MFTRYPALICALLFQLSLSAQTKQDRFSYEINAGFNLSTASFAADINLSKISKPGFQVGAGVNYNFAGSFFAGTGLYYTTKGSILEVTRESSIEGPVVKTESRQTINQYYLQLPVKIGYQFKLGEKVTGIVHTGAYYAYGIGGKTIDRNIHSGGFSGMDKSESKTFGKKSLKKADYGWLGGIGASISKMLIMLHYEIGIRDINQDNKHELSSHNTKSYKNRNASLTLGYRF